MTLIDQIHSDMDRAEKTNLKVFLDRLYKSVVTYTYASPRTILREELKKWFDIELDHEDKENDKFLFADAMMQGKTTCAAHHLMKLWKEHPEETNYFCRKIQLLIWAAIGDGSFKPSDPMTRISEMFTNNNLENFNLFTLYGHAFLAKLHVSETVCEATDNTVASAARYFIADWLTNSVDYMSEQPTPGDVIAFDPCSDEPKPEHEPKPEEPKPTDDPTADRDAEKVVVLKEGETAHVEVVKYLHGGNEEFMCNVTLHQENGQSALSFRPLAKAIPGDYVAKCDVTRAQLYMAVYDVNQGPDGDGKHMRRVVPVVAATAVGVTAQPETTAVPTEADLPFYEKMKETLHHVAELSTVTNGGHTGCIHNATSWADEFLRNVAALFSYDIARNIHTDTINKYNRLETMLVGRFDERSRDNTVLSNIGSVLQIIKMLACVRRDNVQDHPTPHGYEYVIDRNKYNSMVKRLYGVDLSGLPEHVSDHRYHVMAALKGAAD